MYLQSGPPPAINSINATYSIYNRNPSHPFIRAFIGVITMRYTKLSESTIAVASLVLG